MKDQKHRQPSKPFSVLLKLALCLMLTAGALVSGCTTGSREEPKANASPAFDAQAVARLSHEAYQVAYDARFWAIRDLRFSSFRPTRVEAETVEYLDRITHHVPWLARDIEKHPGSPRSSSKRSRELVRYDAMMLKRRYQPASFRSSTDAKIEKLINLLEKIESHYE